MTEPSPTTPLVTIGVATYNRVDSYFPTALDSARAQGYPQLEIVVCDNASSDGTDAYMASIDDPRIRYVRHPENIGANANYNACLEHARGRYFLLLHDDDRIDPDFIESCMAAVGDREVGVVRSGTRVIDDHGATISEKPNLTAGLDTAELLLAWFDRRTAFYLSSTLFHTDALRAAGGFRTRKELFQDVAAIVRLSHAHGRVDLRDVKASFRRHGSNKGGRTTAFDWADDSLYLLDLICDLLPERAEELRASGEAYLCRKCYRYVAALPSAAERWRAYNELYRAFGRRYHFAFYLFDREYTRLKSKVVDLTRGQNRRRGEGLTV